MSLMKGSAMRRRLSISAGVHRTGGAGPASTSFLRRLETDKVFRVWLLAWPGGSLLGVVNGTARELLYKD